MGSVLVEYILATRPWSFTAGAVPVLVTAAVLRTPLTSSTVIRAFVMAIAVQAGANLTNTYYDFVNGVDNKANGEKTLVDQKVSPFGVLVLSAFFYLISLAVVLPEILSASNSSMLVAFTSGILLAFFYTAKPVGLKYYALGDVTIFICFGPLLMQGTSLLLSGEMTSELYVYSIPIGLLTEAILHANNARDIKADVLAGAFTLATLLGPDNTYLFFNFLLVASYASIVYIGIFLHWGCLASLLTVPLALGLVSDYRAGKMMKLPEETAKMHLPFGILMLVGIMFTKTGLL